MKPIFKFLFFALILFSVFVFFHELTHGVIYRSFDCVDISYSVDFSGAYTHALCSGSQEHLDMISLAQSINEVVGYCVMPFVLLILLYFVRDD
jgi:hypothetical protein